KELVTIVKDVPVNLNLEACHVSTYDRSEVVELFRELEFINLLPRLPQEIWEGTREGASPSPTEGIYQVVNSEAGLNELISQLEAASEIVLDLETTLISSPSYNEVSFPYKRGIKGTESFIAWDISSATRDFSSSTSS
ncbi:unnamed protein product, partial [marine sediment metagenome]